MIRRLLSLLVLTVGFTLGVSAQCSIDKLVDEYSAVGQSKFTSAVERDPKTRKVVKVVKMLELNDTNGGQFVSAFESEAKHRNSYINRDGNKCSGMFHIKTDRQHRIYTIQYDQPYNHGLRNHIYTNLTVTIIIKYK